MTNKIRVAIIKANDNKIIVKDDFIPTLENIQKVVGGWLEACRWLVRSVIYMGERV